MEIVVGIVLFGLIGGLVAFAAGRGAYGIWVMFLGVVAAVVAYVVYVQAAHTGVGH